MKRACKTFTPKSMIKKSELHTIPLKTNNINRMKSIKITLLLVLVSVATAFAQVPASFNYQAVVRNSSGEILTNKTVSFRISLLQGSKTGAVVYSETHKLSTNDFGLVNLKIGTGTKLSGNFSPADWGEVIFTKVEIDPAGGSSFSELATSELSSVPYAFKAQTVVNDKVNDADADPTNEIQEISISGTTLQLSKGGGTVVLPSSGGGSADNWGTQTVVSDETLTGEGTTANPLSVVADGDGDNTNELQTLSIKGQMLAISDGNSIEVPSAWSRNDPNIFRNNGNVGIGLSSPSEKLHIGDGNIRINNGKIILGEPNSDGASSQFSTRGDNTFITNFSTGDILLNTRTELGVTVPANPRLKITAEGDVKVYNNLTVSKNLTIEGGTPGAGKVLTSDANGKASWQTPATGGNSPWQDYSGGIYYGSGPIAVGTQVHYNNVLFNAESYDEFAIAASNHSAINAALYSINSGTGPAAYFAGTVRIWDGTQGAGKVLTSDADGFASWQTPATGGSSLWTESGSNIYRSSGNVGIGTTTPSYNLDINASDNTDIRIKSNSSNAHLKLDKATSSNNATIVYASDGSNLFFTGLSGDNNYSIKSSSAAQNGIQVANSGNVTMYNNLSVNGNVGIGTSSPTAPLEIKSNEVNALIIGSATANYNQRPGIQFKNNTSQFIAGDDGSNEVFGFYSKWASTRAHDARLRVYGAASGSWGKYIQLTHDGTNGFITTDAGNIAIIPDNGNVGIKTHSPTEALDVNGNARVRNIPSGSGTYAIVVDSNGKFYKTSSDRRLKENIKPLDNSLDKILNLRGVSFTWKANPEYGTRIGFIAQEFEKVIPELAFTNPVDGYKGINYAEVTAVLVEAVKEQQKIIEKLKAENSELKADNSNFESRLQKLENIVTGYANK